MSLSPHEEKALAALEEGLRADDPLLATMLEVPPSPASRLALAFPLSMPRVVALLVALLGLIAAGTVLGDRPAVLAAVTAALLVPWLVGAARRSRFAGVSRARRGGGRAAPRRIGYFALSLGVAVLLVVLAVAPPTGRPVVGLVLAFLVAPWLALRVIAWIERGMPKR
jgi:hypothetical protein